MIRFLLALVGTLILSACSTGQKISERFSPIPGSKTNLADTSGDVQTIAIMGINDFHGALAPHQMKSIERPGITPIPYEMGGAAYLASHVRLLRSVFQKNFFLLDAGDALLGTLDSNLEGGAGVIQFFNEIGVNATVLGNHEFDFGPASGHGSRPEDPQGTLKLRMTEANFPYLAANIIEKKTRQPPQFPNLLPSTILTSDRLKVGVIGLATLQTPAITRIDYVSNLAFTDQKEATLREASRLREQGAQVIVLLAHSGISCQLFESGPDLKFSQTSSNGACNPNSELFQLLNALPQGTVDAVVSGHSHTLVHHWINGVPVIQGGSSSQYYNVIYMAYDWKQKKILTENTRIEGHVPVCPKVFANQRDCNGARTAPENGRGNLVTPEFHGAKIQEDRSTAALLQPIFERNAKEKKRVIGHAARPILFERTRESDMGNLVVDAVREAAHSDIALVNPGGIRAPLDEGPITYEAAFRSLPFDNFIVVYKITGKELKMLLRVAECGSRGYFPVSGIKVKLIDWSSEPPSNDLNGNGRIDPWELNRLLEVTLPDGTPIDDAKTYTLALPDFLATGGDDLSWPMSQISKNKTPTDGGGVMRDALAAYLKRHDPADNTESPLVSPAQPRLIMVKWPQKKHSQKKKHRRSTKAKRSR